VHARKWKFYAPTQDTAGIVSAEVEARMGGTDPIGVMHFHEASQKKVHFCFNVQQY
jgi:hypothetical protein